MSLIWSYIGQEVRKCSSVSTSFCGQCAHSLSSLESQVCLGRPFSIARLCSLSLYIVKAFLKFGSVTVVEYSEYPTLVIGVKFVSTFVDWGDQPLIPNIREDARAKDYVKEF